MLVEIKQSDFDQLKSMVKVEISTLNTLINDANSKGSQSRLVRIWKDQLKSRCELLSRLNYHLPAEILMDGIDGKG